MRIKKRLFRDASLLALAFFWLTSAACAEDFTRRVSVGDLDVLVLRDADVTMEKTLFPDLGKYPELVQVFANGPIPAVDQVFFARLGDRNVLIDSGWGDEQAVKGRTLELLRENGVDPATISDILLTHLDIDHAGGLVANGKAVYPNATLRVSRPEYEAWTQGKVNRGEKAVELARKALDAYKVELFEPGAEVLPGIKSVDASGHTPGHAAYDITSGKEKMTVAGDLIHAAPVQLVRPEISSVYDMDKNAAAKSRERLLKRAAEEKSIFAGMHFPMVSDVRKADGAGYLMKTPR